MLLISQLVKTNCLFVGVLRLYNIYGYIKKGASLICDFLVSAASLADQAASTNALCATLLHILLQPDGVAE